MHGTVLKNKSVFRLSVVGIAVMSLLSCKESPQIAEPQQVSQSVVEQANTSEVNSQKSSKFVVYQVFTRLFGNTNTSNIPWGTLEQNGVGKFSDFTPQALQSIKDLGTTHIWYTGVPHHALVTDYTHVGISLDDPDVIKGRAGSPYAVKDYYNVNPDLADDPESRLQEFEALIERTHQAGMKVVIDIVPNHVARRYESLSAPQGVVDFGAQDDTSVEYRRDNDFYYVPDQAFSVPENHSALVLGGESHPMSDGSFAEMPAKWTGNGARAAQPSVNDWYETVKINYGVRPDGTYDFPTLPPEFAALDHKAHADFWKGKELPASWFKFRDIALYWLDKGVDGFRFDMAEMVPVEFWSFLNSSIKQQNPDAFLLAEVYQPDKYRDYLALGKMDYLYDKVGFYDTLKAIMQGRGKVSDLVAIHAEVSDIAPQMLHFLENHDEQRIASPDFAGSAERGKPALVVSATISQSPTLLYFGQDVGEDGSEDMGFGDPTRTSIFDYAGVPAHQRWMNDGAFDGGQSSDQERSLRAYYERVMAITTKEAAIAGSYTSLHQHNLENGENYSEQQFVFVRSTGTEHLLVVSNFASEPVSSVMINIPKSAIANFDSLAESLLLPDLLNDSVVTATTDDGGITVKLSLDINGSVILKL